MNNKGSIYAGFLILFVIIFLFLVFFGVTIFQVITIGELHNIKNDLYLINRNVLISLQRDIMGEDKNAFYEEEVENKIEEEIKRQWNVDVSSNLGNGFIKNVEIENVKIVNLEKKMYIESILRVQLEPIIFKNVLKDKFTFRTYEKTKVEKMKGWRDEQ